MNICINFYGQQRYLQTHTLSLLNQYLLDDKNTYHILFTGWDYEPPEFESLFPTSFVKRIHMDESMIDQYEEKYNNIRVDTTNLKNGKRFRHILKGFYIKSKTKDTILSYMEVNNINFDMIVTLRTDTLLKNQLAEYWDYISNTGLDKVYISAESMFDWDIYNIGAYADILCIANYENTIKIVDQFNQLDHCTFNNNFHPETGFYLFLHWNTFSVIRIPNLLVWIYQSNNHCSQYYT